MKVCPQCQTTNFDGNRTCKNCNTLLIKTTPLNTQAFQTQGFTQQPPTKKGISTSIGILIAVGAMLVGCGMCGVIGALIPRKEPVAVATPTPPTAKQTPVSLKTDKDETATVPITKSKSKEAQVININANLRNAPDEEASIIKEIPKDTIVKVIQQKGAWFLVDNNGSMGWMHGNTIKLSNQTDQPIQTQPETKTVRSSPVPSEDSNPTGATARCVDGTLSYSRNRRGTCSHHGGVARWY